MWNVCIGFTYNQKPEFPETRVQVHAIMVNGMQQFPQLYQLKPVSRIIISTKRSESNSDLQE